MSSKLDQVWFDKQTLFCFSLVLNMRHWTNYVSTKCWSLQVSKNVFGNKAFTFPRYFMTNINWKRLTTYLFLHLLTFNMLHYEHFPFVHVLLSWICKWINSRLIRNLFYKSNISVKAYNNWINTTRKGLYNISDNRSWKKDDKFPRDNYWLKNSLMNSSYSN